MNTRRPPEELAKIVSERSLCKVQVGATLSDAYGRILAWGWNNDGGGKGMCAEYHAILRANPRRVRGAGLTVFSKRKKNSHQLLALPCGYHGDGVHSEGCFQLALDKGIRKVKFTLKGEGWGEINLATMRVRR